MCKLTKKFPHLGGLLDFRIQVEDLTRGRGKIPGKGGVDVPPKSLPTARYARRNLSQTRGISIFANRGKTRFGG